MLKNLLQALSPGIAGGQRIRTYYLTFEGHRFITGSWLTRCLTMLLWQELTSHLRTCVEPISSERICAEHCSLAPTFAKLILAVPF
jgi:hypothetical protein